MSHKKFLSLALMLLLAPAGKALADTAITASPVSADKDTTVSTAPVVASSDCSSGFLSRLAAAYR